MKILETSRPSPSLDTITKEVHERRQRIDHKDEGHHDIASNLFGHGNALALRKERSPNQPFTIVRKLSDGGMGAVYLAFHSQLKKNVVVKTVIDPTNPQRVEAFEQEMRVMMNLRHPHIVKILRLHRMSPHCIALVMEYCEEGDLEDGENFYQKALYEAPPAQLLILLKQIFLPIAKALEMMHQGGIIHADVKPSNILIGKGGIAKLADFGISISTARAKKEQKTFMLSPRFASPEQFAIGMQDARTTLSPASDIYSFFATLYTVLTKASPICGGSLPSLMLYMHQQWRGKGEKPRDIRFHPRAHPIPDPLAEIIMKGLSPSPNNRLPHGLSFVETLKWALLESGYRGFQAVREPCPQELKKAA